MSRGEIICTIVLRKNIYLIQKLTTWPLCYNGKAVLQCLSLREDGVRSDPQSGTKAVAFLMGRQLLYSTVVVLIMFSNLANCFTNTKADSRTRASSAHSVLVCSNYYPKMYESAGERWKMTSVKSCLWGTDGRSAHLLNCIWRSRLCWILLTEHKQLWSLSLIFPHPLRILQDHGVAQIIPACTGCSILDIHCIKSPGSFSSPPKCESKPAQLKLKHILGPSVFIITCFNLSRVARSVFKAVKIELKYILHGTFLFKC